MIDVDSNGTIHLFQKTELFEVQEKTNFTFLKEISVVNKFPLVILCVQKDKSHLSENEQAQLLRILTYLKKSFDNTPVIICTAETAVSYQQLKKEVPFDNLIIFGGNRKLQGINIDSRDGYKPTNIGNETFFFSHDLATLESDEAKKRMLRPALDQLNIK